MYTSEGGLGFPDTYSIKLRCVANFIYNIAYYNAHKSYTMTAVKSIIKSEWVVNIGLTPKALFEFHLKPWAHWLLNTLFIDLELEIITLTIYLTARSDWLGFSSVRIG